MSMWLDLGRNVAAGVVIVGEVAVAVEEGIEGDVDHFALNNNQRKREPIDRD